MPHLPVRNCVALDQLPSVPLGDIQPRAQLAKREHTRAFSVGKVQRHANHSPTTEIRATLRPLLFWYRLLVPLSVIFTGLPLTPQLPKDWEARSLVAWLR